MYFSTNSLKATGIAALAGASIVSAAPRHAAQQPRAIYFQTNTPQNNIVALPVQQDGTLAQGSMTPTGGSGLQEIDGKTGQPASPDGLSSQDSVVVAGKVYRLHLSKRIRTKLRQCYSISSPSTLAQTHYRCSKLISKIRQN